MLKKIKDITKAEMEAICDKYDDCNLCPLSRLIGCKFDPFYKDDDEEEVEV